MNRQDITEILLKVVLNTIKKFPYRILLQIIQNLHIQYFLCHVRICIIIIGIPNFLYCCIILIMVLCHGRSPIQKKKQTKTIKNTKIDYKKQKINLKKGEKLFKLVMN